jgi:hypothetical protein
VRVTINGVDYASWAEVPPEAKQQLLASGFFADADRNGVPDILEGRLPATPTVVTTTSFSVGGRSYASFGQLPPEVQQALRQAGLDRAMQGGAPFPIVTPAPGAPGGPGDPTASATTGLLGGPTPVITTTGGMGRYTLVALVGVVVVVCVAAITLVALI